MVDSCAAAAVAEQDVMPLEGPDHEALHYHTTAIPACAVACVRSSTSSEPEVPCFPFRTPEAPALDVACWASRCDAGLREAD